MKKTKLPIKTTGKITSKKPWNRINLPVYSISSKDEHGNGNMNIITYCTAISMQPKRFVCGVYHNTQTLANLTATPHFVLQLLAESQYRLVDLLGKKSGSSVDKIRRLQKREQLVEWNGFYILKNCLAVMELSAIESNEAGDHTMFLCDLLAYKNMNNGNALTLDTLRSHNQIRI